MGAREFIPHELEVDQIDPDENQPRKKFDGLEEMAATVKIIGIIQPIIVRPHPDKPGRWMIVIGERRWRSAILAGRTTIPVFTRADVESDRIFFMQIVENLEDYRHPLEALEKASALQLYVEKVGVEKACEELGQKKDWISRETALAKVPVEVWDLAAREKIQDKRTILDLHRLCKHTGRQPEDEWQGIKESPKKREALHARMESSGVKKKRQPKDGGDDAGTGSASPVPTLASSAGGDTVQLVPQARAADSQTDTIAAGIQPAPPPMLAQPGRFVRKGLNNKVKRAAKVLGIDSDSDFEAFLEELLNRAVPEVKAEGEVAAA